MDPETTRTSLTPTVQTHFQLDRVIQAAFFFFYSPGICVSGVFSATGSCVNLRHALLLFAAAWLMWWPREPRGDCLTRLSASWLWAELSGDNVSQILLLSHALCIHAAARRQHTHTHKSTHRPLFALHPNSKQFSDSLMLPKVFRWRRKPRRHAADMLTRRCWNMSSVSWCVCFGGCTEQTHPPISLTFCKCSCWWPEPPLCLGIPVICSANILLSTMS